MTPDIKALVKELGLVPSPVRNQAALTIERLAGEVESLRHDVARHMNIANAAEAERDRLKAENERLKFIVEKAKPIVAAYSAALGDAS